MSIKKFPLEAYGAAVSREELVQAALDEITKNYREASLSNVARSYGVSLAYVSECVRAQTGRTYKELLQKHRMETAARLGVPEEKSVLLQHLILSHHGEPEFGAAVRPLCAEAELLSLIDAVDSRMEIYRETYDTMGPDTFSPRIFALEKKVFRHA